MLSVHHFQSKVRETEVPWQACKVIVAAETSAYAPRVNLQGGTALDTSVMGVIIPRA